MIEEDTGMPRDVFDSIYETLMANNWRYTQRDEGMTPDVYYNRLREYAPKDLLEAVLGFIDKEELKSPPSIGEIKASLRQITESRATEKQSLKNREKETVYSTRSLLSRCVAESRLIIDANITHSGTHKSISSEGKRLLKECGLKYQRLAPIERQKRLTAESNKPIFQRSLYEQSDVPH